MHEIHHFISTTISVPCLVCTTYGCRKETHDYKAKILNLCFKGSEVLKGYLRLQSWLMKWSVLNIKAGNAHSSVFVLLAFWNWMTQCSCILGGLPGHQRNVLCLQSWKNIEHAILMGIRFFIIYSFQRSHSLFEISIGHHGINLPWNSLVITTSKWQ